MANYTPTFTKPYPSGWVDKPSKTTPATAAIMNSYDTAIAALEAYLRDNAIKNVSASTTVKSGTKTATITIDGTEYVLYSPSVSYESAITGGTKVGTITVGSNTFDIYAPSPSAGGSTVSVVPKTLTGTNIAEITVDGTTYQLYAPTGGGGSGSTVTAEATLTEGTQIGKITIDGVETILYAPTASPITVDAELSATSENPVQNKIITAKLNEVFQSVSDGKSLIASAITDKGVTTAADATFQVMADNIEKISVSSGEVSGNNFRTGISMNVTLNFQEVTWNVITDPNPSVSASFGESIVTNWNGGSYIGINIYTAYPIDLTNIKSIKIKYTESSHYGNTFPFWLGITSTKYMTVVDPRNIEFDKKVSNTATGETEITMDVSDISGQKYIYIMPIGYTCTITDLILEKEVDTRFEIAEPTEKLIGSYYSTLIYTQAGANYYTVKANDNTSKYWAIGFITRWSNWYVPVIVSNTADYAHVISTNTGSLSGIYTFEYENKTYYCNNGIQGAYEWTNPITYKAIPLYDVADSNFSGINTEAAWIYMAKKLLDFYFGKEEFPQ